MDLWIVLKDLEDLENRMADLYEWFSRQFSEDKEAATLFYTMSLEEISHRDLVRYQRRLVSKNPKNFQDVDVGVDAIREAAARIENIIHSPSGCSLKEAVMISIDAESDATEYHYRSAMRQANPEVSKLVDNLCSADRLHFARLSDFARSRGFLE